jgi:hypothetical protein
MRVEKKPSCVPDITLVDAHPKGNCSHNLTIISSTKPDKQQNKQQLTTSTPPAPLPPTSHSRSVLLNTEGLQKSSQSDIQTKSRKNARNAPMVRLRLQTLPPQVARERIAGGARAAVYDPAGGPPPPAVECADVLQHVLHLGRRIGVGGVSYLF